MREFKYRKFVVIKEWLTLILGSGAIGILVYLFTEKAQYAIITGVALAILFTLIVFFEARQRIIIDGDTLKVYKASKLKNQYDINSCSFKARTASGGNNIGVDCKLIVLMGNGEEDCIDCTKLGWKQFEELLDLLGFNNGPQEIEVVKKEGE